MKLLLDENLPHAFRHFLPGHDVDTVAALGWQGVTNGKLLANAAAAGFDALLTMDAGIQHQQNLGDLPVSVLLIRARSNVLDDLKPLAPAVLRALEGIAPRTMVRVG
ncbi:MAG: hypothetical protein EA376_11620 [Phycisphaeraceae bacterium]|nr:MAG: hypothetical protein EA376_11620 [Phycisphaeraceae bacterium]